MLPVEGGEARQGAQGRSRGPERRGGPRTVDGSRGHMRDEIPAERLSRVSLASVASASRFETRHPHSQGLPHVIETHQPRNRPPFSWDRLTKRSTCILLPVPPLGAQYNGVLFRSVFPACGGGKFPICPEPSGTPLQHRPSVLI